MKIECACGALIVDQTDDLPHKAHVIPDQEWNAVLEAIDAAIEQSGPSAREKEAACMAVRTLLIRTARQAWQCAACGRVYVDDREHHARELVPADDAVPRELFRSRAS